jgi:hypothetical protein
MGQIYYYFLNQKLFSKNTFEKIVTNAHTHVDMPYNNEYMVNAFDCKNFDFKDIWQRMLNVSIHSKAKQYPKEYFEYPTILEIINGTISFVSVLL